MNSLTLCHKVSHNRQTTFSCDVTILIFSLTGNKKGQNDNMGLRTTYKRIKLGLMQRYLAKVIYECGCLYSFSSVTEGTIKNSETVLNSCIEEDLGALQGLQFLTAGSGYIMYLLSISSLYVISKVKYFYNSF